MIFFADRKSVCSSAANWEPGELDMAEGSLQIYHFFKTQNCPPKKHSILGKINHMSHTEGSKSRIAPTQEMQKFIDGLEKKEDESELRDVHL